MQLQWQPGCIWKPNKSSIVTFTPFVQKCGESGVSFSVLCAEVNICCGVMSSLRL